MTDDGDSPKAARGPAYPFISLPKAIERLDQIHAAGLAKHEVAPLSFYKSWGYKQENGNARQILAALNHFGLVEYLGRGKDRKVKLSRPAHRILLDKIPNSPARAAAIKEVAINPKAYSLLWEKFRAEDVQDHVLETYLTLECDFTEEAASKVIEGYRATIEYAGLDSESELPDDSPSEKPDGREAGFVDDKGPKSGGAKVGDYVQWETNGALAFERPRRVRHVTDDGEWLFVEDSETGVPMSEVIVENVAPKAPPPKFPLEASRLPSGRLAAELDHIGEGDALGLEKGERELTSGLLSKCARYRVIVSGHVGPKEIDRLIEKLKFDKEILADADEDEES